MSDPQARPRRRDMLERLSSPTRHMRRSVVVTVFLSDPARRIAAVIVGAALVVGACTSASTGATVAPTLATAIAATPAAVAASPTSPTLSTPTLTPPVTLFGPLPAVALDKEKATALQGVLDGVVRQGAPDVIAAVITEDGTWAGAAGIGGPDGRKATANDEFAIASITKTFTATLILRLVEQGKMDLDAPLAKYLGDLKVDTNGATVRQALEMRAGLADLGPDVSGQIHVDAARVWTAEDIVADIDPPIRAAGESYSYSSPSYELLAFAAEHATGKSYAAALRAELLDPWHADRIQDQGPETPTPKPWAQPIDAYLGAWTPADVGVGGSILCISSATRTTGGGSMASDAPSLAAWVWHLFAGDILGAPTLNLMRASDGPQFAYGFGRAPFGAENYESAGAKTGYGSQLVVFPLSHAVVVIFVNDQDFITDPVVSALLKAAGMS